MDSLSLLQLPAMLVTVVAAWLVASSRARRRHVGFWFFLLSNALWIAWAAYAQAYAFIVLQLCLAAVNIRGARKSADSTPPPRAGRERRPPRPV